MSGRRVSVGFQLSPSKRRSISQAPHDTPRSRRSMAPADLAMDVPQNNDEREKKERQLSRLQKQMQDRAHSSPAATPGDRRKSLSAVTGLSNIQLAEHYSQCIQLSAENKISVKNAFNFHLIDYMSEMLRRKDSDMNNFQVASCTLDASTKIYAYRVDSVHTDTLKMAGGLGRTQDKDKNKDQGEEGDVMAEGGVEGAKKKKRVKKKTLIESNTKNLDVNGFDIEFEIDPLFKKTSTQFDDGRSGGGQFLDCLQLLDDSCQMVLDADTVIMPIPRDKAKGCTELVLIPKLPDLESKVVCPTFAAFDFGSWNLETDETFCEDKMKADEGDKEHQFDMDAEPEPLDNDFMDDDDDNVFNDMGEEDDNGTVLTVGQAGCQRVPPPQMEAVHLKDHLASNPSEYSYFDTNIMSAWAGPGHWRIKALSKVKSTTQDGEGGKKKKKAKEFVNLSYEVEADPEIEKLFEVTRKATKLSKTTLKQWGSDKTTLPVDLHYDGRDLTKLYGRPAIIIRRQQDAAAVDDSVQEYDYDNQHDRDNFCADVDDGASGYGDNTAPGYDMTDLFSQTVMGSQQQSDKGMDFMDNLVEAPNKVAKINIGYARTAKKVDMKKLKSTMWTMLSDPNTNKENDNRLENQATITKDKMDPAYQIEFTKLYRELPCKLSSKMSESLSVPLAFIGLLHLANEHNLHLSSSGDMRDFQISQG